MGIRNGLSEMLGDSGKIPLFFQSTIEKSIIYMGSPCICIYFFQNHRSLNQDHPIIQDAYFPDLQVTRPPDMPHLGPDLDSSFGCGVLRVLDRKGEPSVEL